MNLDKCCLSRNISLTTLNIEISLCFCKTYLIKLLITYVSIGKIVFTIKNNLSLEARMHHLLTDFELFNLFCNVLSTQSIILKDVVLHFSILFAIEINQ